MLKRDYIKGDYEQVDKEFKDVGSGEIYLKLDGMISFAFSDLQIFSDSGYSVPLNPGAFEEVTEDVDISADEADIDNGGSGKTVYVSFRVLDPTYQSGSIYVRINNFGAFTTGKLVGVDYVVVDDSDLNYSIDSGVKEVVLDFSKITADRTVIFTKGDGCNIRNKVRCVNPSSFRVILTDGIYIYWCEPKQEFAVYFNEIFTRSKGWGVIYDVPGNLAAVPQTSLLNGSNDVVAGDKFWIESLPSTIWYTAELSVPNKAQTAWTQSSPFWDDPTFTWDSASQGFGSVRFPQIKKIQKWYTGF